MKLVTILVMLLLITACAVESDVQTSDAPPPTPAPTTPPEPTATAVPIAPTVVPEATAMLKPTSTPEPSATSVPTASPVPTETATPLPTATPVPTSTPTAVPSATPIPTATPEPTSTPEPTATPEPVPVIGTATEADGSIYTVNIMRDPAPVGRFHEVKEGMRLIAFDITQEAVTDSENANPLYFRLQDDQDYVYGPSLGASDFEQFATGDLNAGQKIRGWVAFELPTTFKAASVLAEGEILGPRTLIADLINFDALDLYDDNNNGSITCAEASNHKIVPVGKHHPAYEHMDDADDDGIVCE